jgi:hypothetical protein
MPPAPVLAIGHLLQVLHQSHLLANDRDDNEMKSGTVHSSSSIYLTTEKNLGKPQLGYRQIKAV